MMIYEPGVLAARAVPAHAARPATAIVHDAPGTRVVVFRIEPGQQVAPHTSPSAGDLVVYEPNERHGMRAVDKPLVLLAIIAPRPGAVG